MALQVELHEGRLGHQAVLFGDEHVLVAGGIGEDGEPHRYAEVLNVEIEESYIIGSTPVYGRPLRLPDGRVAVLGHDRVWVLGVQGDEVSVDTVHLPVSRWGTVPALIGAAHLLIAGGCCDSDGSAFDSALLVDLETGETEELSPMALARGMYAVAELPDDRVLFSGGITGAQESREDATASAEVYDPATRTFALVSSMLRARRGHEATVLEDGRVLITGVYEYEPPYAEIAAP